MKFCFSELTSGAQKAGELKKQCYELSELIIGRGGRSTIVIPQRTLSLEHAALSEGPDQTVIIRDLGSISGVRVNGEIIRQCTLADGDIVSLGTFEFKIIKDSDAWVVLHEKADPISTHAVSSLYKKLQIQAYVPRNIVLSSLLVVGLIFFYVARPYMKDEVMEIYSVGQLSPHHAFVGKDCKACHTDSFQQASDAGCNSCHTMTKHFDSSELNASSFLHAKSAGNADCISCHTEHKGKVTYDDNRRCVSCHANLVSNAGSNAKVDINDVSTWLEHPEFRTPKDRGTVKLNHAVHMRPGLQGDKGPETLQCSSCHVTGSAEKRMQPVSYKKNCARCHTLEFDERLPGKQVPHLSSEAVFNYLKGTYAQMALKGGARVVKGDEDRLHKAKSIEAPSFNQNAVANEVRDAQKVLFTKTGCVLCHAVTEEPNNENQSIDRPLYKIEKAAIRTQWLRKAEFAHGKHNQISCESCHGAVANSKKTSDVLMPKMNSCKECHASAQNLSDCVTCHNYHDALPLLEKYRKHK